MSLKQAVIYGSNGGIGLSIAKKFLENNFNLCLFSRNGLKLKENIDQLKQQSSDLIFGCEVDVRSIKSIESSVKYLKQNQLPISTLNLIICSGINQNKLIVKETDSNIDNIIQTNLVSSLKICKLYSKLMIKQNQESSIVLIGSVVGLIGNIGQSTYSASKSGLIGLVKSLSKELIKKNIRVNLVIPGFIDTQMLDNLDKDKIIKKIPLGRLGEPSDVANAVYFLSTNKSMNGELLVIDGGLSRISD